MRWPISSPKKAFKTEKDRILDAFFFPTSDDLRLFGVARGPQDAAQVWIICPPFAEEEKTSRRLFTLIAADLAARGAASLVFSLRGTGDSEGNFAAASLSAWKRDLQAAKAEGSRRFPRAQVAFLGVRLGASLAWQQARELSANRLILIEPLVSGRSFLMQQSAKKQIREQLTGGVDGQTKPKPQTSNSEDFDGWEVGPALKNELGALDLRRETPQFAGATTLLQVGPRAEVAPPLQALAVSAGGTARAVVMPPFWNLIDAPDFSPLLQALHREIGQAIDHE